MTSQKLLTSETQIFGDRYGDRPTNQRGYASGTWVRGVCVYTTSSSRPATREKILLQPSWSVRKSIWRTLTCPNVESVELRDRRRRPYSLFQIRQTSANLAKLEACRSRSGWQSSPSSLCLDWFGLKRSSFLKMPGWHLRTWLKTSNVLPAVGWRVLVLPPLDHPHWRSSKTSRRAHTLLALEKSDDILSIWTTALSL